MWWYNILGNKEVSISHLLRLGPITVGSILRTVKLVARKRGNCEPNLKAKRNEWKKFIDYLGPSIEADQSRVVKKKICIFHFGYIPSTSYVKLHISRQHLDKDFNL